MHIDGRPQLSLNATPLTPKVGRSDSVPRQPSDSAVVRPFADNSSCEVLIVAEYFRFADLPDDVIVGIFCALDVQSVLSLRLVLRRVHALSKKRDVWAAAFRKLLRPPLLDRPLASHTSAELERVVAKAEKLHWNWTSDAPSLAYTRERWTWPGKLPVTPHETATLENRIVETLAGGRWFLVVGPGGSVTAFDLAVSPFRSKVIISPNEVKAGRVLAMSTCVHADKEPFAFDLALCSQSWTTARHVRVCIWRVELDDNSELEAHFLRAFDAVQGDWVGGLSLFGDHVLVHQNRPQLGRHHIDVFAWPLCSAELHCVCSMWSSSEPPSIVRLLHDRALGVCQQSVVIYDLAIFSNAVAGQAERVECIAQVVVLFDHFPRNFVMSPPAPWSKHIPASTSISCFAGHAVHVLDVPSRKSITAGFRTVPLNQYSAVDATAEELSRGVSQLTLLSSNHGDSTKQET